MIWRTYLQAKSHAKNVGLELPPLPTNPFTGKLTKRVPSAPKGKVIQSPRLVCCCIISTNLNPGLLDQFNDCIAKCRKRSDPNDQRHSMDLAQDSSLEIYTWQGEPNKPTCPSCKCICNKLYHIKDIMAIALAIKQRIMRNMMNNGPLPSSQLVQFIGQSFTQGRQAADDLQNLQRKRQSTTDTIDQTIIEDKFWDSFSEYVTTRMASSVPSNVVELLHQYFPRGTKINISCGQPFDTRVLTSNNNLC